MSNFIILGIAIAFVIGILLVFYAVRQLGKKPQLPTRPSPQPTEPTSTPIVPVVVLQPLAPTIPDDANLTVKAPLSPAEIAFFDFLTKTISGEYLIMTRTLIKDFIVKKGHLQEGLYTMHENGHLDFLLLDPTSKLPVLAIELDDAGHNRAAQQDRDRRKDELLERAKMRLLRIRVKYWGEEERKIIREALPKQLEK